jgi:hypothetical protein
MSLSVYNDSCDIEGVVVPVGVTVGVVVPAGVVAAPVVLVTVAGVPIIFVAFTFCVVGVVVLAFGNVVDVGVDTVVDVGVVVALAAVGVATFDVVAGFPVIFVVFAVFVIGVVVVAFGIGVVVAFGIDVDVDVDIGVDVGVAVDVDFGVIGVAGCKKIPAFLASLTSLSVQFLVVPDKEPYGIVSLQSSLFTFYLIYSCLLPTVSCSIWNPNCKANGFAAGFAAPAVFAILLNL